MKCPNCKADVLKVQTVYYPDGGKVSQCRECPEKAKLTQLFGYKQGSSFYSSSGKMTPAHSHDISRRRLAPDGRTVYRDTSQKTFVMPS